MNEVFEKVTIVAAVVVGGIIGIIALDKIEGKKRDKEEENFKTKMAEANKTIDHYKKKMDDLIDDFKFDIDCNNKLAGSAINDIHNKVDHAVKTVYDTDAKVAFARKLDDYDFKSIAINECKDSMQDITDSELRKLIYAKYSAQVHTVLEEEIRKYFSNKITDVVQSTIDENYIQRTARNFIKDEVIGILEDRADKAIDDCDVDDIVKDYLKERSVKLESIIRKTVTKLVSEKVDNLDLEVEDEPTNGIHITFG